MELNPDEFDSLTKKLEQYAAQLSTLQTKLELEPEIGSLNKKCIAKCAKVIEIVL